MNEDFRHYLNFKSDTTPFRLEITEPVNFDASSFSLKQDNGRFGRDVVYGNADVSEEFWDVYTVRTATPQMLPDGTIINHLNMGLDWLLEYWRSYGFEAQVERIVSKDDVDFVIGMLDYKTAETDGVSKFKAKIVQNTKAAQIKRRADTKIDLLSDKNIDLQPIAPMSLNDLLLKAKPLQQISTWQPSTEVEKTFIGYGQDVALLPIFTQLLPIESEILTSVTPFSDYIELPSGFSEAQAQQSRDELTFVRAQEELTQATVQLDNVGFSVNTSGFFTTTKLTVNYGGSFETGQYTSVVLFESDDMAINVVNQSYTVPIPFLPSGGFIWMHLEVYQPYSLPGGTPVSSSFISVNGEKLTISVTATAMDSVINAAWYIDMLKQIPLSINGMPLIAPRWDVGGQFHKQMVFDGKRIRQFTDKPFYITQKDAFSDLMEVCADYQVNSDQIFIGIYNDYYPNREIAVLHSAPDDEYEENMSEKAAINLYEYNYKNYGKAIGQEGTNDGFNTEAQFSLPNKEGQNKKEISLSMIRDDNEIERARKEGINTANASSADENDDRYFITEVIELAPGTTRTYTRRLLQRLTGNTNELQILNNSQDGSGTPINWTLLGFGVGSLFYINSVAANQGVYFVTAITPTILTLFGSGADETIDEVISFTYPITNVQWTNRTNEGFDIAPPLRSNLNYTIRRNMRYWEPYLATACKYRPDGIISNTYFKNNGELTTKVTGSPITYIENENINVSELQDAILSPMTVNKRMVCDFDTALQLFQDMQRVYPDGTVGGFIRTSNSRGGQIKIYASAEAEYTWADGVLTFEQAEVKNESNYLTINTVGSTLIEINEVGYPVAILANQWYRMFNTNLGDFVTLVDMNNIALTNPTRVENTKVNGIAYDNIEDLATALSAL